MQLLCYLAVTLLCCLSLSSSEARISCNETQYLWPLEKPKFCCNKCLPGTRLDVPDSNYACTHECKKCEDGMYQHSYNMAFTCNICENCKRTNMEYLSLCNATHNAVCKCKAGYECKAKPCVQCLPIPTTTTTSTLTPTTLISTDNAQRTDASWYPIIIALLSAGLVIFAVVFVITNKTALLRCISSVKYGYPRAKPHTAVPMRCGDEEISRPVQEAGCECILKTELELLEVAQIQG